MVLQEPIAVIGFDLMFPGDASTPAGFAELLAKGRSAHGEVPKDRYDVDSFYHPDASRAGSMSVRTGHFLKEDVSRFDAPFFSFTATEADCLDPQQRMLLEGTYRALENAGISLQGVSGTDTSVFSGAFTHEYRSILLKDLEREHLKYAPLGLNAPMLANRISWFYNLKAQSLTVETACSSSLVACHLAAQSLDNKESSMAIVTGCNLIHNPDMTNHLCNLGVLSPDGKSYSFDEKANGYARGEGIAVVILKRVSDAIRDGNTIRGIIRNIGCNQDGKSPGVTMPTAEAQSSLMNRLYTEAGLDPGATRYFEAHATGTAVGDPIEMSAINSVFSKRLSAENPMYVGSVKTNVGHLEGAAGLAGLLKSVYILESGIVPKNLWFEKWNPQVQLDESLFLVPTTAVPWPDNTPRRISLNSFGIGGTNAHVILEDARSYLESRGLIAQHSTSRRSLLYETEETELATSRTQSQIRPQLYVLSAFDQAGVKRVADSYVRHLEARSSTSDETYLDDLSYTLAAKRSNFHWRAAVVANDSESLCERLRELENPTRSNTKIEIGLVFTGQGAQWLGMGRELLRYAVFRESIEAANAYLQTLGCSWSLTDVLSMNTEKLNIETPALSHPTVTALQVALVDLLHSWSVAPHAVIGHSSGEIAAAYASSVISRESAWKIAYHRGRLSSTISTGAMIAVSLGREEAKTYVEKVNQQDSEGHVTIACINSPKSATISGSAKAIDLLSSLLDSDGIFGRKLRVVNAYHSSHMDPIAEEYAKSIGIIEPGVAIKTASVPKFFSSYLGRQASTQNLLDPAYWVGNLLSPVEFSKGLQAMMSDSVDDASTSKKAAIGLLVEVGPHSVLQSPIRDILQITSGVKDVTYTSMLIRNRPADGTALEAAGYLFCRGYQLDVSAVISSTTGNTALKMLVDLPAYPFDHSTVYWNESRLSKNYRFRKHPRHDLLGSPVPDWNPSNAIWGHFIRAKENPWVKDHVITGSTLYPAAGMLVMAIEACKQLVDPALKLAGFRFKDVSFHTALDIPEDAEGIETRFHLRPLWEGTSSQSATWSEFELWSYQNDEWRNHCRGWIQADTNSGHTIVDGGLEQVKFEETCAKVVEDSDKTCLDPLTHDQVYEAFDLAGLNYGPSFRNLSDVSVGPSTLAAMTLTSPDLVPIMPYGFTHPHVIHPTSLDSAISGAFIALHRGGAEGDMQAAVPTSIKEMWIASSQNETTPLQSMRLSAGTIDKGARKFEAELIGVDPQSRKPLLTVKGLVCTSIAHGETTSSDTNTCYNVDWRPDATLLKQENALRGLNISDSLLDPNESAICSDTHALVYAYLKRYLKSHSAESVDSTKSHYQKYLTWAQRFITNREGRALNREELDYSDEAIATLETRLDNSSAGGRLTVGVGRVLPDILSGARDPLQVLFTDQLAENIYHRPYSSAIIGNYMRTLAHKNPHMQILEVGAGTGATTGPVLEALTRDGKPLFGRYDFTDLSPAFLAKAEQNFQSTAHKMGFATLNIEQDPLAQDFEQEQYDVIIASNVIHATRSIHETLRNIRLLLKPGGKFILFEVTNLDTYGNFSFGLLPGWWLSTEEYRKDGPLLTVEGWDSHLKDSGFGGIDLCFDDGLAPAEFNVMMGTAKPVETEKSDDDSVSIVIDDRCALQQRLAGQLETALSSDGSKVPVEIVKLVDLSTASLERKTCIFLPELFESVLAKPNEKFFSGIKNMCGSARAILWVVQGGGVAPTNPTADMVLGFARTMRMENAARFLTLSLSSLPLLEDCRHAADTILQFVNEKLLASDTSSLVDNAFCEHDGLIMIPRLVTGSGLFGGNGSKALSGRNAEPEPTVFGASPERALMLEVATPGLLDSMRFVDDDIYSRPLGEGEVEFRIMAAGQNFRHLLHALGQLPNSANGAEAAGIVTRTGPNTPFSVGDRVFGCHQRLFGTFARGPHHCLAPIPSQLSFCEAAAIPIVFMTAYMALYDFARIQRGETVLIHSAAGGLGQACIQLAQLAGAEVFATVGSLDKRDLLVKTYGIPADHIFSSRDLSFARGIMRMTGGKGVDVAVNSLSGAALRATWECLTSFGRFAECGKKDVLAAATLPMHQFLRNVSFRLIDLEMLVMEKKEQAGRLMRDVMQLVAEGSIKSIQPLHVFPYSQVQESYKFMQSGKHFGKIVLESRPDDVVMATPSQKASWTFSPDATYVISGGLGGIGRGIARWMTKRGARNLVLLSRTGPTRKSAQALMAELKSKGVMVSCPAADVTDAAALRKALDDVSAEMPPVKGCIQAAMVLKATLFANMSVKDYTTCVDPKLQGSLNLQEMLPSTMDFFVLLSSFAGLIGEPGEANYAAGNTYQDSLARHLVSKGQKAVAIDLGMMGSIGYVAESLDRAAQLEHIGLDAMRPHELYNILDEVCDPSLPLPSTLESQAVFGVPKFQDPRSLNGRTPLWKRDPIFIHLRPSDDNSEQVNGDLGDETLSCRRLLSSAESPEAALEVVIQGLAQKIWNILKADVQVDLSAPLHSYGVDSLVAIELRSWIVNEMGAEMTIFELMGSGGLDVLAPLVVKRSAFVSVKG
ncbi:Highly reducing polyketide synthase alt5 [Colletotrichum fructicola]|nr:Highly reducing polyketide synthase alt5 [Colletotrichum fructicola]KAF4935708.1 Highly reducing polyketide synthase alt5 [Colletotrichum fructicola]